MRPSSLKKRHSTLIRTSGWVWVLGLLTLASGVQAQNCTINPCGAGCPGANCNSLCPGGNTCGSGCPNRCNAIICTETATCDPNCGGDPCGIQCHCWDACPTTICTPGCPQFNACSSSCVDPDCTPGCPGGNLCNDGCADQCNPVICPGNYCDTACNAAPQCDPLCGGSPCNDGCIDECNFFLCPQKLCDVGCRPIAACDPACGGNPCAANCPTTGCACPANRCFNLEIDYMVDTDHSHKPNQAELDAVVQMFACQGWTLNIQVSDAIPHYDLIPADPPCLDIFKYFGEDGSFGRLKQQYADHAFEPGWHYAIFGHDYELTVNGNCVNTQSSGLAETPGNDLVVTLGSFGSGNQIGTPFDRAATLAHEFGHNLGLTHCGDMDDGLFGTSCDNVGDFAPNLASIMSYMYQLRGVRSNLLCQGLTFDEAALFREIDYSHGRMCNLNENALDEVFGIGMMSVDWNCSGAVSGTVAKDLNGNSNGWCGANTGLQTLSDFDEWAFIEAEHALAATAGASPRREPAPCITAREVQEHVAAGGCPTPTLTTENCENRDVIFLHPAGGGGADGTCTVPYQNLQNAHNAAADNSVLFFRAGSYAQPGSVLLTKPMKLFSQPTLSQSTAVITAP